MTPGQRVIGSNPGARNTDLYSVVLGLKVLLEFTPDSQVLSSIPGHKNTNIKKYREMYTHLYMYNNAHNFPQAFRYVLSKAPRNLHPYETLTIGC